MKYTKSVPAAVAALLFTAACDSADVPVGPEPGDASLNRAAPQGAIHTPDDEFARAARAEVPGFAGYYLQDDGTPVVRLTDPAQRGAAQRYLAQELVRARGGRHKGAPQQPVFLQSEYDFAQLKGWFDGLNPLLQRDDVFLLDVDEVRNRVHVGVADATAIGVVRAEAARLGIPAAALNVETQQRPQTRATVQDWSNPLVGGIQIAFGQYVCTLGFNATRVSTGASIFVTNSHCTTSQFAVDGSTIYQHTNAAGNAVGTEVADRGLYACITGVASCRRADAAFIGHNGSRTISQGGIARTSWPAGAGPAPLTRIADYDVVARYAGSTPVGTYLDKTGRTTGSTYGQVTSSCVTIGNLRCQDVSKVYSAGGDSGSPMFVYLGGTGTAENDVQLQGILWGGPGTDYTTTYSSRLQGIELDLGTLSNLCRPGYGC